ncbi:MAG: hypothetical protein V4651_01050 [Bacteroidota bacterium]
MRFLHSTAICCIILSVSCVSTQKYTVSQRTIERLQSDSTLLEKRVRMLQDEVGFLGNKSATMEQALTQRLQEKEDSLNQKQQLLSDKEMSIKDMKARKAEERDAFIKLSDEIIMSFGNFADNEVVSRTNCTQTIVEVSDRILFQPSSSKIDAVKLAKIVSIIADVMRTQPDLKLMVVNHTDSVYTGKEKWDDNWSLGSAKANGIVKLLIREYKIAPQRLLPATQADYIELSKPSTGLGKSRTAFLFYSELLPCIHTGE